MAAQSAASGTPGALDAALAKSRDLVRKHLPMDLDSAWDVGMGSGHGPNSAFARLAEAMLYACEGGKGLRGFLVLEGARLHGIEPSAAAPAAAAIEALHAYSLVHDDLPCMDDDDLRRGRPTVHRKWDEATAVLAGDALQAHAFHLLTMTRCSPRACLALVQSLASDAGLFGMVGGQMADLAAEIGPTPLDLDEITILQGLKTGALLAWAASAGARMAEADPLPLDRYGRSLGLAFQIADDLLDAEGSAAEVGKATGKDAGRNKATFVSLLGLDGARARARSLAGEACDALAPYGPEADTLREAAQFVIDRRK